MKRISVLLLALAACSGGSIMTMNTFSDIPLGSTSEEVVTNYGAPYSIHKKSDGTIEYEYLERIKAGSRNMEERRYILVVKDGKVVSKHIKQSSPPPYTFDSYEMQTTQNGGRTPPPEE